MRPTGGETRPGRNKPYYFTRTSDIYGFPIMLRCRTMPELMVLNPDSQVVHIGAAEEKAHSKEFPPATPTSP